MIDITMIIESVIGLIISIITVMIIPKIRVWLKNKLTAEQINIIKIIVESAVKGAEQLYINTQKSGSSKKKYVLEFVKSKLSEIGITINDKEIELYLEQAVLELKENQKVA